MPAGNKDASNVTLPVLLFTVITLIVLPELSVTII